MGTPIIDLDEDIDRIEIIINRNTKEQEIHYHSHKRNDRLKKQSEKIKRAISKNPKIALPILALFLILSITISSIVIYNLRDMTRQPSLDEAVSHGTLTGISSNIGNGVYQGTIQSIKYAYTNNGIDYTWSDNPGGVMTEIVFTDGTVITSNGYPLQTFKPGDYVRITMDGKQIVEIKIW